MSSRRRIAITGLGAISPLGLNVSETWKGLIEGRSGIGLNTRFDTEGYGCKIAAEVDGFEPSDHFDTKEVRHLERFVQFSVVTAREAYAQSGLADANLDPTRIGAIIGGGIGGISYIEESCHILRDRGPRKISPFMITKIISNMAPGQIAIDLGIKGPNMCVITACAAGSNAIGEAGEMIRRGAATAMIAGGTESAICPIAIAGFDRMRAVCCDSNDNPTKASRPFDATRSGFVLGEGAGALVLEEYEFAKARGATILAELIGYGLSSDAFHATAPAPHGEGAARALQMALDQAGIPPSVIGYVNAHGTSTTLNDKLETESIKTVFGEHIGNLMVSSNKSMTGHLLGAAGAVEAVATIMTLQEQIVPPTINYQNPDPDCDLDYVPNVARKVEGLACAISNSLGFGGHNGVLAIARDGGL